MLRSITTSFVIALALAACADPPPAKMVPSTGEGDGVAANSASEQRLGMNKPAPTATTSGVDPSQPYTTPLSGDPNATPASSATTTGKNGKPGKGPKEVKDPKGGGAAATTANGPKVSKAECKQLFDKYVDLMGDDPRFAGIPPEMIAQMKQAANAQATAEKGDPCSNPEQIPNRSQYNCAIAAPTTAAWQRCMPK